MPSPSRLSFRSWRGGLRRAGIAASALTIALTLPGAAGAVRAQQAHGDVPAVAPGAAAELVVQLSDGSRSGLSFRYVVAAAPGMYLHHSADGRLEGVGGGHSVLRVPLTFTVPATQPAGPVKVAMARVAWSDGTLDSIPIRVNIGPRQLLSLGTQPSGPTTSAASAAATPPPPLEGQEGASVAVGGLTREVEVELYGSTRTASPGGLVVLRYSINSYADQDERVRLRLRLPAGWTLLDRDVEGREFLLEGWENIEGEIRVMVPRDAKPGERHRIYVSGEVVGEPGAAVVFTPVQVLQRGGLKAGEVGLEGTMSVLAGNLQAGSMGTARYGGMVQMSGKMTRQTTLSLDYRRGPRETNLTNFRIPQDETRWTSTLRNPRWSMQAGNQIGASGGALTGPFVRGRGASLRRTAGHLVGELTMAQPTSYVGSAGGHVVRGNVGVSGQRGHLLLAFSDFGRPAGGYSTVPRYPEDISPDSLERLERERRAAERAPGNRVRGGGLDAELRAARMHRLALRGGWLRLDNAKGDVVDDASAEIQYGFNHRRASFNARWRQMPRSLQGILLPGNESAVDGTLKIAGELRLAGRLYHNVSETVGNVFSTENDGQSLGVRYQRSGWRFDVSGNRREWSYGEQPTLARTLTLFFGVPVGPLSFNGFADVGEQRRDTLHQPMRNFRTDLRWTGGAGTASWSTSSYEALGGARRLRTDVLGTLKVDAWELAGGAWATRGWARGGEPGLWTQVGVPVGAGLLLTFGVEHAPPSFGEPPVALGTIAIRKRLALPLPFLRDASVPGPVVPSQAP